MSNQEQLLPCIKKSCEKRHPSKFIRARVCPEDIPAAERALDSYTGRRTNLFGIRQRDKGRFRKIYPDEHKVLRRARRIGAL